MWESFTEPAKDYDEGFAHYMNYLLAPSEM